MIKICIEKKLLPVADMLLDIFTMRMANAGLYGDINALSHGADVASVATSKIPQSYDVLLCSAEFAEQNVGTTDLTELLP